MTTSSQALAASAIPLTIGVLHARLGGTLTGEAEGAISGVNTLEAAGPHEAAFAETEHYLPHVQQSRAGLIVVHKTFPAVEGRTLLRLEQPRVAFAHIMSLVQPPLSPERGVDRHAVVAPDAHLGEGVTIRECAVIRSGARIGRRTIIESGVHIGEGVVVGDDCVLGPNVVVMRGCRIGHRVILHGGTVIGADGFGYVWEAGRHLKIPQLGNVIIEDDVELGANVCVDRATLGSTLIKRGTKIDNLVQIAHNDVIGEHVIMSGQVGLAGSVQVGNRVMLGAQAGVADHLTIGDDARVRAGSGVIKDVPAGQTVWWFPARPIQRIKRELAALSTLPERLKGLGGQSDGRRSRLIKTSASSTLDDPPSIVNDGTASVVSQR